MPEQKDMTLLGKAHSILDARRDSMALQDRQKSLQVRASADDRGIDIPREAHHAVRDHRDAPD